MFTDIKLRSKSDMMKELFFIIISGFLKSEHSLFSSWIFIWFAGQMWVRMVSIEELHDVESKTVDVEVDIAGIKVGCAGFPE